MYRIGALSACVILCVLFLLPRAGSVGWNDYIHGDVGMDASAAATFANEGTLLVFESRLASPVPDDAILPPSAEGKYLAQHGPVWAMLGGLVTNIRGATPTIAVGFFSLKLLSLLSGMLVLVLAWIVARRMLGETDALWALSLLGASYLLVDYSGNGSFYAFQAALYLLWILAAMRLKGIPAAVALGIIGGVAYLLNFQAIVLLPAAIVWFLCQPVPWSWRAREAVVASVVFVLCALPWFIRNELLFGDPFWSHAVNSNYLYIKAGMTHLIGPAGAVAGESWNDRLALLHSMTVWFPQNAYYVARKLFVLLPLLFLLFPFAFIDLVFMPKYRRAVLPVAIVLIGHLFLSAAWPVVKFRYFVPMLPLAVLLTATYVRMLGWPAMRRNFLYGTSLALMILLSIIALQSTPTHTAYYDGAITTDPFSDHGELQFLKDQHLLQNP